MNSGNSVQDGDSRCAPTAERLAGTGDRLAVTAERLAGTGNRLAVTAERLAGTADRVAVTVPSQDADRSISDDRQSRPRPRFQHVQDIQELVDQLAAVTRQLSHPGRSDS